MDIDLEAPGLARIIGRDAPMDRIAHGLTFGEGPVWDRRTGQLYWVDSTIVPLKDNDGQVVSYLSARIDVSARKQKEIALRERLKEITNAQRSGPVGAYPASRGCW